MKRTLLLVISTCSLCLLSGCGGGESNNNTGNSLPTINFAPSLKAITVGQSVELTWSSTKATSCMASAQPAQSDWAGSEPVSGSQSVTPAAAGTVTYSLTCTGTTGNAFVSVLVTVNPPALTITTTALPDGTVQAIYGTRHLVRGRDLRYYTGIFFALTASGGTGSYSWSWAAAPNSSLPPGLKCCFDVIYHDQFRVIASVRNAIYGVPTTPGTYSVVVTVSDGETPPAQASKTFSLTVNNPPPPVIKTKPAPSAGGLNLPYSFTFTATGGLAPLGPWNETGTLPPGLTLSPTGVLAGTPTATGSWPISVTVKDAAGQTSAPQPFTIQVFPHGFKLTGSMGTARQSHTATLLNDGTVLVTGGSNSDTLSLATAELYDPIGKTFAATTGDMTSSRYWHTATLLNDGTVLVTGGRDINDETIATAELYDPSTKTFTATTGAMVSARSLHTATLLNDGTVLVTGGFDVTGQPLTTAELYDPATKAFTVTTGNMATARAQHTATLLNDGTALAAGGYDGTAPLATAELYDPTTKTFSITTGSMTSARLSHTATLLNDGTVLLTGGAGTAVLATAELYDPASKTFSATTGGMTTERVLHTATFLLNDGTVLVVGGQDDDGNHLAATELYDPAAKTFTATGSLTTARGAAPTATLLNDGTVLVTGGVDITGSVLATADLYQ